MNVGHKGNLQRSKMRTSILSVSTLDSSLRRKWGSILPTFDQHFQNDVSWYVHLCLILASPHNGNNERYTNVPLRTSD